MPNHEIIHLDTLPQEVLKLITDNFSKDEKQLAQLAQVSSLFYDLVYGFYFNTPYKQICLFNKFIEAHLKIDKEDTEKLEKANTVTFFKADGFTGEDKFRMGLNAILFFGFGYFLFNLYLSDLSLLNPIFFVGVIVCVAITLSEIKTDANADYAQQPIDLNYLGKFREKNAFFKGLNYSALGDAPTRGQTIQFHQDIIANISEILELFPQLLRSMIGINKLEIDPQLASNDQQKEILTLFLNLWNKGNKEEFKLSFKK